MTTSLFLSSESFSTVKLVCGLAHHLGAQSCLRHGWKWSSSCQRPSAHTRAGYESICSLNFELPSSPAIACRSKSLVTRTWVDFRQFLSCKGASVTPPTPKDCSSFRAGVNGFSLIIDFFAEVDVLLLIIFFPWHRNRGLNLHTQPFVSTTMCSSSHRKAEPWTWNREAATEGNSKQRTWCCSWPSL